MPTAFPLSLPRPTSSGYGYQVEQPHSSTPNDRGLGRRRRLGIGKTVSMSLSWRFTQSELQEFAQWWRDSIAYGTDTFEIQLLNGYDDITQDVRPMGPYVESRMEGLWDVSMAVEVVDPPIASQSVMQDAIDNYDGLALADQFHYTVHVIIPENIY